MATKRQPTAAALKATAKRLGISDPARAREAAALNTGAHTTDVVFGRATRTTGKKPSRKG